MLRRLAAVLCLLALLAPAEAAMAFAPTGGCVDACCGDDECAPAAPGGARDENAPAGDDDRCPPGCPECACGAVRPATPVEPAVLAPGFSLSPLSPAAPAARPAKAEPREILHVPLG